MNLNSNLLSAALVCAGIGVGAAGAADNSWLLKQGFFGSPAQGKPEATINISNSSENIYVDHFATAGIENGKGQRFIWRFDSAMEMSAFPLETIAPRGFDAGNTWVNVLHPSGHFAP